jgi:hypothetical protein
VVQGRQLSGIQTAACVIVYVRASVRPGKAGASDRRLEGRNTETFAPISPPRASSVTIKSLSFSMNASKYLQEKKWSHNSMTNLQSSHALGTFL